MPTSTPRRFQDDGQARRNQAPGSSMRSQFAPTPRFIFSSSARASSSRQRQPHLTPTAGMASFLSSQSPLATRDRKSVRVNAEDEDDDKEEDDDDNDDSSSDDDDDDDDDADVKVEEGEYEYGEEDEDIDDETGRVSLARTETISRLDSAQVAADQDLIEDSDDAELLGEGMVLDSVETVAGDTAARRSKRRHPSSSPPFRREPSRSTQRKITSNRSESIHVSSSPSMAGSDVAGSDASEDSLDLMPAPKRPARKTLESPSPTKGAAQMPLRTPPTKRGTFSAIIQGSSQAASKDPVSHPQTPARQQPPSSSHSAARFQFTTPRRATEVPLGQQRQQHDGNTSRTDTAAAPTGAPSSTPNAPQHPQFIFSPPGGGHGNSSTHTRQAEVPLPEIFSPRRRGPRFVPGGLAEMVRDRVLEVGAAMHTTPIRQVYVTQVNSVGSNGALAIECVESNSGAGSGSVAAAAEDFAGSRETRGERTVHEDDDRMDHDRCHGGRDDEGGGQGVSDTSQAGVEAADVTMSAAGEGPAKAAPRKRMLLVGADEAVARQVRVGDTVKVRHGWNLRLRLPLSGRKEGNGSAPARAAEVAAPDETGPAPGESKRQDEGEVDWEVCWGPVRP